MKIKSKKNIGIQKIARLEVESTSGSELSNSFLDSKNIVHHNCNGPHVPLVVVDELDTLSGEGLKAFKEISGMLDSKNGKQPLRVNISTRKSRYGLMEAQISAAEKLGKEVRRWTVLEFMQRCSDDRSGVLPTTFYVSIDDGSTLPVEEWNKLTDLKKKEYEVVDAFDKCPACPLAPWCRGDAKKQESKSPMLKSVNEVIAKVLAEGPDWTSAQLFNLRPSVEGIVFKEFDERVHVKTWNQMWEVLTGKTFPGQCTHDIFIKKCHDLKLSCYGALDFGWSSPNTLVIVFIDNRENIYVVRCDGQTFVSHPAWIHHVRYKWHPVYNVDLYFPDTADPGDGVEMRKLGLAVATNEGKDQILTGVQVIKKWLRVPGSREAKIFIAEETCKPLIQDFLLYHFKTDAAGEVTDVPDSMNDHWLDPLRYIIQNLFGKNQIILSSSGLDLDMSKVVDDRGNFYKTPTAEEFARVKGISLNTEINTGNIGKIGRLSELDEIDEEVKEGGFIWSF